MSDVYTDVVINIVSEGGNTISGLLGDAGIGLLGGLGSVGSDLNDLLDDMIGGWF